MQERFDEQFYLRTYPDVAEAVRSGGCASAYDHYVRFGITEGRKASRPAGELLASRTTDTIFLELTSRCNLRCTYCAVSQPTYRGIDLALDGFDNFLEQMRERGVRLITMNGHGESTIIKDWEVYSDRLADAGFRLHITTNMAKRLTPAEIAVLSRFERILVSLDTVDPQLTAQLRRGASIETIFANIAAVQQFAAARRRSPQIGISCTVGDISATSILEMVEACLARDIRMFRFGDLAEYERIDGVMWMQHLSTLPPDHLAEVSARFRRALARIEEEGGSFELDAPLVSLLLRDQGSSVEVAERDTRVGDKAVHYVDADSTQTRDCLDPWRIAFVQADASVRPCCFFEEKLGTLMTHSLEDVVEGEQFRKLRGEMLSGELRPNCRSCSARPLIGRDDFQRKVEAHLERTTSTR
ncbi:MAG: radical SAM/SPASM domain-containing protein [Thermoanaerobaculia bacterium]